MPGLLRDQLARACRFVLPGAASLLLLAMAPAQAADSEAAPGTTKLHLSQTAERMIPRDRIRVQLRAESVASDPTRVQAEVNKRMTAALDRARAVPGVRAETTGYSVFEEHQTNVASRWHGSQTLVLTGGDFAALLGLAGALQGDGLVMSNLTFELAPETARGAEDELTSEALTRLRQRAERIASDLRMKVVGLGELRVGNVIVNQPHPPIPYAMAEAKAPAMPPPAAEAGEATVQVTVEADLRLAGGGL
ncbi:MAG TPA: SIMPL domain-containing protein [Stellaceae bacterium]|nr:SIMPL domain-containing protein [Stellaceae bacterium]